MSRALSILILLSFLLAITAVWGQRNGDDVNPTRAAGDQVVVDRGQLNGRNAKKFQVCKKAILRKNGVYLVMLKSSRNLETCMRKALGCGAKKRKTFSIGAGFKAFTVGIPPGVDEVDFVQRMVDEDDVAIIAPDITFSKAQADGKWALQDAAPWHLDRLDQRFLPLGGSYNYSSQAGAGVNIYIMDSGINAHEDFKDRLLPGYAGVRNKGTDDTEGHGTACAGLAAGKLYGVAKKANLVPVRFTSDWKDATAESALGAISYVVNDKRVPNHKKVMSMSFYIDAAFVAFDQAVIAASNLNITFVAAAGNFNADACRYSPARVSAALTVGATTNTDARAGFSNWGSCVDIYAPGEQVRTTSHSLSAATIVDSGTSFAAPMVAGAVAIALGGMKATETQQQIVNNIRASSTRGLLNNDGGAPESNRLLFTGTDQMCRTSANCQANFHCDVDPNSVVRFTCQPRRRAGGACSRTEQCISGHKCSGGSCQACAGGEGVVCLMSAACCSDWCRWYTPPGKVAFWYCTAPPK